MKSLYWILLPLGIVAASAVVLYPNFADRELELAVRPSFYSLPDQVKQEKLDYFWTRWKAEYNQSGEWSIDPEGKLPEKNEYFLVKGRFITSAAINQISQENPELVEEANNVVRTLWIEDLIHKGNPLNIKLGLDLQGGMRVVLKGDFENYTTKLKDIYQKEIDELQQTIDSPSSDSDKVDEAKSRLEEIQDSLSLDEERKLRELRKAKLIIDNRLTNQNLTEPQVRVQKDQDSIEVSLPGVSNSSEILDIIQNTETVEYRLQEPIKEEDGTGEYGARISNRASQLLAEGKREETEIVQFQKLVTENRGKEAREQFLREMERRYNIPTDKYTLFAFWARGANPNSPFLPRNFVVLEKAIALSGNDLRDAKPAFNNDSYGFTVSFSLTPRGAEKFFEITSNNVGRNLAIVWGNKVVSNPRINGAIAGGRAEITGNFSKEEATDLANVISEGALPIPLKVLEMRFIGPTLGIESIKVGVRAVLIGFVLVMFYMLLYYRFAGLVADIALLANIVILAALLSLMDFTMTLPGFAGVILTVGMAVDANVIIYERIKEELIAGKSLSSAVEQGFENAFWTIIDSNVTTLISGILMVRLGNGPIKGFAITLCWGIITSLFTSLVFSRLIMGLLVNKMGLKKLQIGFKRIVQNV